MIRLLPILLAGISIGCETRLDCNAGTYRTMGDNENVIIKASQGKITYYQAGSNLHTPVTKANWHGGIALGGEIAGAALGFGGGCPAVGAAIAGVTAIANRPTSRPSAPTTVTVTKP